MILLTVIAVGLLTLSSISLRSATQADAMAAARANARLALMLALGDLQKYAGPDQRITARADVDATNTINQRLTGVWKSTNITPLPSANDYTKTNRDAKFVGWLTSSLDGKASTGVGYAQTTLAAPVTLWGKGGPAADVVTANKVVTSPSRGAFAYAVMDEGVKARINTPYVDVSGSSKADLKTAQLGTGVCPNTPAITGLDKLKRSYFEKSSSQYATLAKGVTRLNLGLASENLATGTSGIIKTLGNDLTSASVGLFTDTASGGLREDFNLLTNTATLPAPYAGKGVYASRLGITGVSDPRWESLQQFARLYQDNTRLTKNSGVPVLQAQGPAGWKAVNGSDPTTAVNGTVLRDPPPGVVLMPTIAKVQVLFSLMTRDIYTYPKMEGPPGDKQKEMAAQLHGPWGKNLAGSSYDYLLHLLYTPVVTLHNPYNVALEFTQLRVIFGNLPFALQVYRNDIAQSTKPAPLEQMYYQAAENGTVNKRFGMTLKTNGGTPTVPAVGAATFRLLPGEVMMFSPYIPPDLTWAQEETGTRYFSDWDNSNTRTLSIDSIPGWQGDAIGFDLDWFAPAPMRVSANEVENGVSMSRGGCIAARAQDEFYVQFAPLSVPGLSNNKFTVEMFAKPTSGSDLTSSGVIEFDYESPTGLQDTLISPGGMIRYPKTGTVNTMAMFSHSSESISKITTARPFALISAQAKATMGGYDANGDDGQLATKPWCFGHGVIGASSQKVVTEHSANHSHEIAIQRVELNEDTALLFPHDPYTGRGVAITGQSSANGLKFGIEYDIPLGPIQSLTSLNSANPGGSSGYLPRFAQPIGNSWSHPLLDTASFKTIGSYDYLDHSFLLNLALYDHFYFSGLADQNGVFGSGSSTSDLAKNLIAGKPLTDPRIVLYTPDQRPTTDLETELSSALPHTKIASWELMNGAFNINSTSVIAWKAMLGSVRDGQALVTLITKGGKNITPSSALSDLSAEKGTESRISRFRLPASESLTHGGTAQDAYWMGAREYSDAQLQTLATKIVAQIQKRGPFFSMADFVNRRLGSTADDNCQRGALQQAIDDSNLNASLASTSNAGYDIPSAAVSKYKYANPKAGYGPSSQGAPGFLSQADILAVLGNAATARSDTFTIRGYGEARDGASKITATATCEAVVQRVPDYVDPADKATVAPGSLTSNANKTFGRRFQIVSFRWLNQTEI